MLCKDVFPESVCGVVGNGFKTVLFIHNGLLLLGRKSHVSIRIIEEKLNSVVEYLDFCKIKFHRRVEFDPASETSQIILFINDKKYRIFNAFVVYSSRYCLILEIIIEMLLEERRIWTK